MKPMGRLIIMAMGLILVLITAHVGFAAYNHAGDTDSVNFRTVYPNAIGTKLDSCTLCHSGGVSSSGTTLGSCQWCHYITNYGANGNFDKTLNPYGSDYLAYGRSVSAIQAIANLDSDGDGYPNGVEIAAIRYPGDPNDTPAKVPAPYRIYSRDQLELMPQHTQFLLMNVTKSKSGDYYAQYSGVVMEDLLNTAGMRSNATDIIVYSPDGFSWTHPLLPPASQDPLHLQYFVIGPYPKGTFYYDPQADMSLNPLYGWCDYSAPSCAGRNNGDPIPDDVRLLLGIKRDGVYLTPGVLDSTNKLNGEGPFRVVPPQVVPGPPDQSSTSSYQNVIWPYSKYNDHNAGASTRSTTIIKVDPLPPGTTDIDLLEAGWNYIDENKIVVYGAINPVPTILEKLQGLISTIKGTSDSAFKFCLLKDILMVEIMFIGWEVEHGNYSAALHNLQTFILPTTDGCISGSKPDRNDWVTDCKVQAQLYWALNEIMVLLKILP